MDIQPDDVEILVHVNAPSLVADDATYRQLGQAYLAFQPVGRLQLPPLSPPPPDGDEDRVESSDLALSQDAFAPSRGIIVDSQDLSFASAWDNRSSPRLPGRRGAGSSKSSNGQQGAVDDIIPSSLAERPGSGSGGAFCAPPSQISDSYPIPDVTTYVSPTRVLQRFMGGTAASSRPPPTPASLQDPQGSQTSCVLNHVADEAPTSPVPSVPWPQDSEIQGGLGRGDVNIVPVTPVAPLVKKRPADTENRQENPDPAWDVTHISGSDVSSFHRPVSPSSRADSEPPPIKRVKEADAPGASAATSAKNLLRSSSDTGPIRSVTSTPVRAELDTLEIRPPSPAVGIDCIEPSALVSEKLAKLATDLSSRYRPEVASEVQSLERGYWLVDCTSWTEQTRFETWAFLLTYLKSGLAGWAVWCRRDKAHEWIRLYCWGHIAKHTYLLLYLASGRHLKFTGAEWRDAAGDVAIRVHPHSRQTT